MTLKNTITQYKVYQSKALPSPQKTGYTLKSMSLANIRRLLQEDNILKLPGLAALSAAQKRVVTIIGLESYAPEGTDTAKVVQLCMVHINTQGKIQWTQDTIAPGINLPSVWMKQHHLDQEQILVKDNWVKGWSQALRHIATNNIVVLLNAQHDLQILQRQYEHYGLKSPVFLNTMGIRDIFQMQHPTRSTTLHDIAAFYQVYLDPDKNLKNRTLTYVKLFEKMITEGLPVTELLTPAAEELVMDIDQEMTLDELRKFVRKSAASSANATHFFRYSIQSSET